MRHIILFILFLIAGTLSSTAQNAELDSLINAENNYPDDDIKRLHMVSDIMCSLKLTKDNKSTYYNYCKKFLTLASMHNDDNAKATAFNNLGNYYYNLDLYDSVIFYVKQSLDIYKSLGDNLHIGMMSFNVGINYYYLSDWISAKFYLIEAIKAYEALNIKDLCDAYQKVGLILVRLGEYREAQAYLIKAVDNCLLCGYKLKASVSYAMLASIYLNFNMKSHHPADLEKSRGYYLKALAIVEETSSEMGKYAMLDNLACIYFLEGNFEKALDCSLQAVSGREKLITEDNNDGPFGQATSFDNIASILNDIPDTTYNRLYNNNMNYFLSLGLTGSNQYEIALECLDKSFFYLKRFNDNHLKINCMTVKAWSLARLNRFDQAILVGNEAYRLADSAELLDDKAEALKVLTNIYEKSENYDSTYSYYKRYIAQRDSIDNQSIRDQLARKEAEYEFSIKEKDLLHQKELSDVAAASANTELQRQLLLTRTREQEILLKDRALEIGQKEKEMQHLAYLKKMAELDVVKLEKQDKDKQLSLTKQSFALQNLKLGKRELERNLLIVGVALSLFSIFLIFRNYRNQRKANLRQQKLNAMISEANQELNGKNDELASTLDNLRTTQAQLVETEKQKENEVIRRRISQDIHDDISSGLTRIAWLSELAKEKAARGEQQEAGNALEKILASSRETVDRLGEIIWAINPDRDNLEGFFAYLRTYIVKFFEDTPFKVTLDFPEKKLDLKFNPDLKRTLFLVVKEALHNVAKHSKASRVAVTFHCPDHRYSITITDDGKGFDVAATQLKGNGLKNMQKRMESVGGRIEIDSQPEKGTMVSLSGEVYN